jgi:hypothetical protein
VHQTLIQTLVFIELLVGGAFFLLIQNFRPKLQISFKRVSQFWWVLSFFSYNFFHQSYKSDSRESALYWASSGCFLLLIQNFPPKSYKSHSRESGSLLSIWWVLSSADTKFSTKVTNFIQESLGLYIEHLVSAFFCWYKTFHQSYKSYSKEFSLYWASSGGCFLLLIQSFFPTKVQSSFKLCLYVCFLSLSLSLSLLGFLCFL